MTRMVRVVSIKCARCNGSGATFAVDPQSLRASRKRAGISLREVARRLSFSAGYISDIEFGKRACPESIQRAYNGFTKARACHKLRRSKRVVKEVA